MTRLQEKSGDGPTANDRRILALAMPIIQRLIGVTDQPSRATGLDYRLNKLGTVLRWGDETFYFHPGQQAKAAQSAINEFEEGGPDSRIHESELQGMVRSADDRFSVRDLFYRPVKRDGPAIKHPAIGRAFHLDGAGHFWFSPPPPKVSGKGLDGEATGRKICNDLGHGSGRTNRAVAGDSNPGLVARSRSKGRPHSSGSRR